MLELWHWAEFVKFVGLLSVRFLLRGCTCRQTCYAFRICASAPTFYLKKIRYLIKQRSSGNEKSVLYHFSIFFFNMRASENMKFYCHELWCMITYSEDVTVWVQDLPLNSLRALCGFLLPTWSEIIRTRCLYLFKVRQVTQVWT
jgi:hypothetical protein